MLDMSIQSYSSTVPNTPSSPQESETDDEKEFASLRPLNPRTEDAFDAALNNAIKRPHAYSHPRRFFHASRSSRARSVFSDDNDTVPNPETQWKGCFKLSLEVLPRKPAEGWYFGTRESDILLAPPPKKKRDWRVAGRHARIFFHRESGRFMIEARHTLTVGVTRPAVIKNVSHILEDGSYLGIGDCVYVFELTEFTKTPAFQECLSTFMERSGNKWACHKLVASASAGEVMCLGQYVCSRGAFAQGTFGQMSAGWTTDGSLVAIKRLKQPDLHRLRSHETVMTHLGYHVS